MTTKISKQQFKNLISQLDLLNNYDKNEIFKLFFSKNFEYKFLPKKVENRLYFSNRVLKHIDKLINKNIINNRNDIIAGFYFLNKFLDSKINISNIKSFDTLSKEFHNIIDIPLNNSSGSALPMPLNKILEEITQKIEKIKKILEGNI